MGLVFIDTRCTIEGSFYDLRKVDCYFFRECCSWCGFRPVVYGIIVE